MFLNEIGEVYRRLPSFSRQLEKARNTVKTALSQFEAPYIALSGGKDSIAMLGIVADVARETGYKGLKAWAHLSDASYPGTAETIRSACEKAGVPLVESWSPVSAFEVIGKGSKVRFGKKGYFFSAIAEFVKTYSRDLAFIGVRAKESHRRRTAVKVHGAIFKTTVPTPITVCYPLAYFSVPDVAAAIAHYGLPFHPIYSKNPFTGAGYENECIRLGYVTSLDNLDRGGLIFLKANYPDLYAKLIKAKPDLALFG